MNLRERLFLICGGDFLQRQRIIDNIKHRILKGASQPLSVLAFYGKEIDEKDLQEKLFTAAFNKSKIVIFKDFLAISPQVKEFLGKHLAKIISSNFLIFETEKDYYELQRNKRFSADRFFSTVINKSAVFKVATVKKGLTIEDFMNSLRKNDLISSLYVLEHLFEGNANEKILGPQIIGILVKKFSYLSDSVVKDTCFRLLWKADRDIKERGLDTRLVIETLLVKLLSHH